MLTGFCHVGSSANHSCPLTPLRDSSLFELTTITAAFSFPLRYLLLPPLPLLWSIPARPALPIHGLLPISLRLSQDLAKPLKRISHHQTRLLGREL